MHKKRKTHRFIGLPENSTRIIFWFVAGQFVQFALTAIAMEITYTNEQLTFCAVSGIVVAAAIVIGAKLSAREEKWNDADDTGY